jgi:hypothetical protein
MPPTKGNLGEDPSKWCALLQILHQVIHIVQVSRQQVLLLLCGSYDLTLAIGPLSTTTGVCAVVECSCELARTALQHCWHRNCAVCGGDGWCFGHEVEIQELDELKLHFSACFAGLEEACDCQEAIEIFEGSSVLRGFDECAYEGYDGGGLDGRAINWFEEVKQMLIRGAWSVFKKWQCARWIQTFMYSSLENKLLEGGCRSRMPWIKSNVWIINRSFCPSFVLPSNLSKQFTKRIATFHSNPSCSLKNSLNAGSFPSSFKALRGGGSFPGSMTERLFSAAVFGELELKQICARRPSTCRKPFRILAWS